MTDQNLDQLELIPPYCPNSRCRFHFGTDFKFYNKNGWTKTEKAPYRNQRFRCKGCRTQFSRNTFDIDFRKKLPGLAPNVLHYSMNGMSNNSIARLLKVKEAAVRLRFKTMGRQALIFEKEHRPKELKEDVAYDGFETFTHSQFSPCYINTVVGSNSMFIYHNTFSPLNRKGRMTEAQKKIQVELLEKYGPYPKDSVFQESCYIFEELAKYEAKRIVYTDEHRAYLRAYKKVKCPLEHRTISSKERRDADNPLFPINHLHQLYRHYFSSQQREAIAFQKHEAALLEKIQLMKIYRNFMSTKFVKKNKVDPRAHEWSPAMYVGAAEKVLEFKDIFGIRKLPTQVELDSREMAFMNRDYPFSRHKIAV